MEVITREQAKGLGFKRYFSGRLCPKSHVCDRLVKSYQCVKCRHLEQRKSEKRRGRKYRGNPHTIAANSRNRRARERGSFGKHTHQDVVGILAAQGGNCIYCRTTITPKNQNVDHIVPIKCGGANYHWNVQLTCLSCNRKKRNMDPIKYGLSVNVLNGRMAYAKVMWCMGLKPTLVSIGLRNED